MLTILLQLEDVEVVVADHVQKVLKTNFAASWEEIGDGHEMKDTYALSQMKSLDGRWPWREISNMISYTAEVKCKS